MGQSMTAAAKITRRDSRERIEEAAVLILVFVLMTAWIVLTGNKVGGPDEPMRYKVAQWFYTHSSGLPRGDDPELLDSEWGLSYAFYPYFSYMICGLVMKVVSLFSKSGTALLFGARMTCAGFMTIGSYFVIRIGKELFGKEKGMLFAVLVIFMPGYHFLGTYVNNDSLSLMSAAIIMYAWVLAYRHGWTWKNCMILAVSMGLCMLSYYNAYGWVLFSLIYFVLSILLCGEGTPGERFSFLIRRGLAVAAVTLGICGWFFIHNALIYNGDFLGRRAATECAEKYASRKYRPSIHFTPQKAGWSIRQLIFFQDPGWKHNWLAGALLSFFGVFGIYDVFMPETVSKIYFFVTWIGVLCMILVFRSFAWHRYHVSVRKKKKVKRLNTETVTVTCREKTISRGKKFDIHGIFNFCMLGALITPFIIFFIYSYTVDIQSQGRYFACAVYALIYFMVSGYFALLDKLKAGKKVQTLFCHIFSSVSIVAAWLNFLFVVVPYYRG